MHVLSSHARPLGFETALELVPLSPTVVRTQASFKDAMWSKLQMGEKVLDFSRHVIDSMPSENFSLSNIDLGFFTYSIDVLLKGKDIYEELDALKHFNQIGDQESTRLTKTQMVSNGVLLSSSTLLLTGLLFDSVEFAPEVGSVVGLLGSIFSGVGSALGMGFSAYRLLQLNDFRGKLTQKFYDPKVTSAADRAIQTLEFLKDSLGITHRDSDRIAQEIEKKYPHLSSDEKEALFNEKCKDLAQVKINALKRRSSMKSIRLIESQVNLLLAKIKNSETQNEAIEETNRLVETLLADNKKKIVFYIISFIASSLIFAAFIASHVASLGTLPFILLAVSTSIVLLAKLVHWIASKIA